MKHFFAIAALALALSANAQSAENSKKSVFSRTEFLVGVGPTNQVYLPTTNADLGFAAGIIEHIDLGKRFFLRTGLLYKQFNFSADAMKATGTPFTNRIVDITPTYQFQHIEIPAIVQYEYPINGRWLVFAGLGTGLSLNLAAYETIEYTLSPVGLNDQEVRKDISDDGMSTAQLAAHATIGAYFKLNDKWSVGLSALSTHHFTRLFEGQKNDKFNLEMYTGNFSLVRTMR